jgi:ATP adenylyltransferase
VASAEGKRDCFLCRVPAESDDQANLLLYRGRRVFVVLNRYPYNTGHLMIAPYAHTADFPGLDAETAGEFMAMTQRCVALLGAEYRPGGFNAGMNLGAVAGAGEADHLHMHVVPRWGGDTNFMPALADVKVMPETLEQTYLRLRPRFDASTAG